MVTGITSNQLCETQSRPNLGVPDPGNPALELGFEPIGHIIRRGHDSRPAAIRLLILIEIEHVQDLPFAVDQ